MSDNDNNNNGEEDIWGKALARHLQESTATLANNNNTAAGNTADGSDGDEHNNSEVSDDDISITSSTRSAAQFWLDSIDNKNNPLGSSSAAGGLGSNDGIGG